MALGRDYDKKHAETAAWIGRHLPDLKGDEITWTSNPTPWGGSEKPYNCFGFVLGSPEWWEPSAIPGDTEGDPGFYWPQSLDDSGPWLSGYVQAAITFDFEECGQDSSWEDGFEKIVLLHRRGLFVHAALQVSPERWKSKLGQLSDFEHSLKAILDAYPGHRSSFMKRRRKGEGDGVSVRLDVSPADGTG